MRIVAVSMVKNELDIIEAFCRHTAAFADHHLIFDHQSTDGTPFVLNRLIRDGLPITVFTDDRVEYLQVERTMELMRRAVRDFGADWVVPLDADEFPQPGPAAEFRRRLADWLPEGQPVALWLRDYAPNPADDPDEPNPVLRLRHRADDLYTCAVKVLVPRPLAADPQVRLAPGNHSITRSGQPLPLVVADDTWLAHFPVRTGGQVAVKVIQGELQRRAGGRHGGGAVHYQEHFRRLLASPRSYFLDPGAYLRGERLEPASYWGEPVVHSLPLGDWERAVASVLPYVARLASGHGELVDTRQTTAGLIGQLFRRLTGRGDPAERPVEFREGLTLPDSRSADRLGCELVVAGAEVIGGRVRVAVRARNVGLCTWRRRPDRKGVGQVNLGVQLWKPGGPLLDLDYHREPIPADLEPGEQVRLEFECRVPEQADAVLRLGMVSEGVKWFGQAAWEIVPAALVGRAAVA